MEQIPFAYGGLHFIPEQRFEPQDPAGGGAPYNGIVNHNHPFSPDCL